jgi:putative FmdB family regulatory protein
VLAEGVAVPTYQYACKECDHRFEQVQSFTDDALTECPKCSGRLRKLYGSVGVVFKGSGFYRTDSRASGNGSGEKKSSEKSGTAEKSGSSDSKPAEKKSSDSSSSSSSSSGSSSSSSSSGSKSSQTTSSS